MAERDSAQAGEEWQGLVIERVFDAPRELVWRAKTEPEQLMRWWGPKGVTAHAAEIDLRVGGRYLWGLQMPNGQAYWNTGVYREIVPPERFVAMQSMADEHGNVVSPAQLGMGDDFSVETMITVLLEDVGDGRTKLTFRHDGLLDASMAAGEGEGWNGAFDKMAAVLAEG